MIKPPNQWVKPDFSDIEASLNNFFDVYNINDQEERSRIIFDCLAQLSFKPIKLLQFGDWSRALGTSSYRIRDSAHAIREFRVKRNYAEISESLSGLITRETKVPVFIVNTVDKAIFCIYGNIVLMAARMSGIKPRVLYIETSWGTK